MEKLAQAIVLAAKYHEESYEKLPDLVINGVSMLHGKYRVSIGAAADRAAEEVGFDKQGTLPVYLLLSNCWNDALDWAKDVLEPPTYPYSVQFNGDGTLAKVLCDDCDVDYFPLGNPEKADAGRIYFLKQEIEKAMNMERNCLWSDNHPEEANTIFYTYLNAEGKPVIIHNDAAVLSTVLSDVFIEPTLYQVIVEDNLI